MPRLTYHCKCEAALLATRSLPYLLTLAILALGTLALTVFLTSLHASSHTPTIMDTTLLQLSPRNNDEDEQSTSRIAEYLEADTPHSRSLRSLCDSSLQIDHALELEGVYHLPVDRDQFDRATEVQLCNMFRPHMRIFHLSWMSSITGFLGWYAIPPLMPVIKAQLRLSSSDVLNSDIASTASTIFSRITVGPLLDIYGPQAVQSWLLWLGAVPVACAAFATSSLSLLIVRFWIGLVGCIFVSGQYWTTITFAKRVVGASNAITGGLGLAGIGFAFLLLPYVNILLTSTGLLADDMAWRVTIALPALAMVIMGSIIRFAVDACPMGAFEQLVLAKRMAPGNSSAAQPMSLIKSFQIVLSDWNTLILMLHYGMCFGAELQLNNMGALYFYEEFLTSPECVAEDIGACHTLTKTQAATVASAFGLMNLVARAVGGLLSDTMNRRLGMRGRLYVHFVLLCLEGALVIGLSRSRTLGVCAALYVFIAVAAQAAGGSTFGIVPYLNEAFTGTVTGLVGAGGNLGGVLFGVIFRATASRQDGLFYMGAIIFASAFFTSCLFFKSEKGRELR